MNEFSLNEVIEMAVQTEKKGYKFYDKALSRKDLSDKAKKLLITLRDEESEHEKTFKKLRKLEDLDNMGNLVDWEYAASYLRTISDVHIFNKPNSAIQLAVEASDELEIINNAIQFEKDTLLFFNSICREVKDEKTKGIINKIIDEEISHVVKLKKILEEL